MASEKKKQNTHYSVPTIKYGGYNWACLNYLGDKHIVAAEKCKIDDNSYSFKGGHRVRLDRLEANVHWRLPSGIDLDITGVAVATPQRRGSTA